MHKRNWPFVGCIHEDAWSYSIIMIELFTGGYTTEMTVAAFKHVAYLLEMGGDSRACQQSFRRSNQEGPSAKHLHLGGEMA